MEVVSVYWSFGHREDIHLMRRGSGEVNLGNWVNVISKETPTSTPLDQSLADFRNTHHDAECTFKPSFYAPLNPITLDYEEFGVKVNSHSGVVSAGPTPDPSGPPLYNFTVLASVVADRNVPASPRKRAYLRIHLHYSVDKAWLSPSPLKVPKNITGFQFSIYAQFDDHTIAELDVGAANGTTWASVPPNKVNQGGFLSFDNTDTDGAQVQVSVRLSDVYRDANALNVVAEGVAIPYSLPQVAHLIPNSAGYDRRNEVPNLVFLADGFTATDQPRFNAMIDLFMRDLRQNDKFKPFDQLVGRMNFWKVFVPSAARGIGTRAEVYGEGRAQPIPLIQGTFELDNDSPTSENDLNLHKWGPNQVLIYFGLPVLPHKSMSNDEIKAYWKQISYLPAALIDTVPGGEIDAWRKLGDRRRVDESDTFLGTYYGEAPKMKAQPTEDTTLRTVLYQMNEQRLTRNRLNRYLLGLQYQDENGTLHPIGPVWDIEPPASGDGHAGKDFDNVIVMLCANSGRAQNIDGQLYTNVISDEREYFAIETDAAVNAGFPAGRAVKMSDLDGGRLPADLPLMPGKTTLLHEISHSLGLGDEYGEPGIAKDSPKLKSPYTGDLDSDRHYSNVQRKSDLILTPTVDGSDAEIDALKIKWRWHRIAKSGVLAPVAPPNPAAIALNGSQYTIRLRTGQAAAFEHSATVILRRRKPGESILKDIEYSQVSAPRYPFVTRSPELAVRSVDTSADLVVVEPVNAGDLSGHDLIADFPAECVLYAPLPARYDFPPTGENLELIAANILEFMVGTRRPVHENMDAQGQPLPDSDAEQSPDLSDPNLAAITNIAGCAKKNRDIVALYAGGETYHHGVYHPTGHCIMRDNHQVAEFCSACKYILTDYIDPSLHPQVDKQFDEHYPLKAP